nr:MAG TPA: hypothetical protein [Caudoviricetes sp.]
MSISASTYRKILSIKTWATNKLPTVTEDSYTSLLTDLLKYLDDLITNNDFFETDIKKLVDELNKLLAMEFPSQKDINNAINTAKTEITNAYTSAISTAKTDLTADYTKAISASESEQNTKIESLKNNLNTTATGLQHGIDAANSKIASTMATHKKNIKDTITGAMTNLTEGE